ncbi:hypothetical protein LguiA_035889 [Lonicera macranthoides]
MERRACRLIECLSPGVITTLMRKCHALSLFGNLLYAVSFRFHPLPLSINTPTWDRYEVLECDISSKWCYSGRFNFELGFADLKVQVEVVRIPFLARHAASLPRPGPFITTPLAYPASTTSAMAETWFRLEHFGFLLSRILCIGVVYKTVCAPERKRRKVRVSRLRCVQRQPARLGKRYGQVNPGRCPVLTVASISRGSHFRVAQPATWRMSGCECPKTIIAVLNEATLLAFDDYTKERCIAAFLLAKKKAYAGDPATGRLPSPLSRISHPFRVIQLAKPLPFDSIVQLPKDIDSVMSLCSEFKDFGREGKVARDSRLGLLERQFCGVSSSPLKESKERPSCPLSIRVASAPSPFTIEDQDATYSALNLRFLEFQPSGIFPINSAINRFTRQTNLST